MPSLIPWGIWAASGAGGGGGGSAAYELISTTILGSSAASVTFSGLGTSAAAYKHLQIRMVARDSSATADNAGMILRFNSDTGANYVRHRLRGDGSTVSSSASTAQTSINVYTAVTGGGATAGAFGVAVIDLLDFASSIKNKTTKALTGFNAAAGNAVELDSGLWLSTAAVTDIGITASASANFATGSRFSLYGLR
jgi:hypothetical protein